MSSADQNPADQNPADQSPAAAPPTPPSAAMLPLITLGVEHVFDTLSSQPVFHPTILAVTAEGMQGMWTHPDLTPEGAAQAVAELVPRPERAVAVFDGEVETPDGPRPAVAVEAFEAGSLTSVRVIVRYLPGVPAAGLDAQVEGDPEVAANGPNPLFGAF
ncbi:hypothetical protein AB0302_09950 [Micrococcus sp. NPDC078436]|uniref:hypothetical protein n=1 Tax=Micrococcus sp. NPDC078436 TaxID=3154960 RepID=UPI00344C9B93